MRVPKRERERNYKTVKAQEIIAAIKGGSAWMTGEYVGRLNKGLFGLYMAGSTGVLSNGNTSFDYCPNLFFATYGELHLMNCAKSIVVSGRVATIVINALMS